MAFKIQNPEFFQKSEEQKDDGQDILIAPNENLKLNEITTNSYTGDWKLCNKTFPEDLFLGLKEAISEIYSAEE